MSKLFTASALSGLSLEALRALHQRIYVDLVRSEPGSPERRDALASLENIQCAICSRLSNSPGQLSP